MVINDSRLSLGENASFGIGDNRGLRCEIMTDGKLNSFINQSQYVSFIQDKQKHANKLKNNIEKYYVPNNVLRKAYFVECVLYLGYYSVARYTTFCLGCDRKWFMNCDMKEVEKLLKGMYNTYRIYNKIHKIL